MAPLREYLCKYCAHQFEVLVYAMDPEEYKYSECPYCESKAKVLPALIGGYQGNMGGASTRPKNSTSKASKKAFTKVPDTKDGRNAFGYDESEQLVFEFEKASKK